MNNKIILFHPGCGPFVQQTARAFYEAGLLEKYVTTFHYVAQSRLGRVLKAGLRLATSDPERQLLRRLITEVPYDKVQSYPLPEIVRMAASQVKLGPIIVDLVWERAEIFFDQTVARKYAKKPYVMYGYEHACLNTFRAHQKGGGFCVYEMPSAHHGYTRELIDQQQQEFPQGLTSYNVHAKSLAPKRDERRDAELSLADMIIVNSSFTKESIEHSGLTNRRIHVVPLGAPPVNYKPKPPKKNITFLSAGNQSFLKGTPYLLQAWKRLSTKAHSIQLKMIGNMQLHPSLLAGLPDNIEIIPAIPRNELLKIYSEVDVFVFPSLAEGFGMVITEAMAHGLPVITTPNTGGRDLIEHKKNGFIVPIRDEKALAETMEWCLDHSDELGEIGRQASLTAAGWQWSDYRQAIAQTVKEI